MRRQRYARRRLVVKLDPHLLSPPSEPAPFSPAAVTGGLDCLAVELGDTWALLAADEADREAAFVVAATSPNRSSSGPGPGLDVVKLGIICAVFFSRKVLLFPEAMIFIFVQATGLGVHRPLTQS